MVEGYGVFVSLVRTGVLYLGVAAALVCTLDWAVRTRRLSPFGGVARFVRAYIDPLMRPVERLVVRTGGQPSTAPWWMLAAVLVGGLLLLQLLDLVGVLLAEAHLAATNHAAIPMIAISWAISLLTLALLVRVLSSWISISPYSPWVRWSYVLTEWMIAPLRRIIPQFGMVDVTPLVAYFLLILVKMVLHIP
jgi:YggT family protein